MSRTIRRRKGNRRNVILFEEDYIYGDYTKKGRFRYHQRWMYEDVLTAEQHRVNVRIERAMFYADGGNVYGCPNGLKYASKRLTRSHDRRQLRSILKTEVDDGFDYVPAETRALVWVYY